MFKLKNASPIFRILVITMLTIGAFWLVDSFNINFSKVKTAGLISASAEEGKNLFQIKKWLRIRTACTDSDGGPDYYTFGTTTQFYRFFTDNSKEKSITYSDKCGSDKNLIEYYCQGDRVRRENYICPEGCESGRCKKQVQDTCQAQGGSICSEYEVCQGKILSAADTSRCCKGTCELPKSFDWRNRHGENWNTEVRNQGSVPYCTQFGPVAAIEAVINLYFNQQLNIDLSEQILNSCSNALYATDFGSGPAGGCFNVNNPGDVICKAKFVGIPDENCYPYIDHYDPEATFICNNLCPDYQNRMWKVADFGQLLPQAFMRKNGDTLNQELISEEKLKKTIMKYGPVAAGYLPWAHVVSIVGWEYDQEGRINWIIKNSWGEQYGDRGYGEITAPNLDDLVVGYVKFPIIPPANSNYQIQCVDKDSDGFCNWGISEIKPPTCPSYCKNEKDWDDSDPNIGALRLQAMTRGPISPPANLRVTKVDVSFIPWLSSITWSWDSVPGASRYEIYGGYSCSDSNSYGATLPPLTTTTMSGFNKGDVFYLKVKACNRTGCSDFSNCVEGVVR
jgi:hypothetical protein